ncbi:hypothetical protein HZB88_01105 [archaeon]|nr:hypothetical protein [archaeon]
MEECGRAGELMNNSLITTVSGNSLKFFQVLNVYCNANEDNLKIVYSKEGNSLLVNEVFDSDEVTRCMCPFKINGEISGLERGSYGFTFSFENKYAGGGFMYDSEFEIA